MKKLSPLIISIPFLFAFYGSTTENSTTNKKTEGDTIEAPGKRYRPIVMHPEYEHNKWGIEPSDIIYNFAAYTTSFDSDDDNNGDGKSDVWGIPEWVSFEIKPKPAQMPNYRRPSPWLTDDELNSNGKAPNDATYAISGTREMKVVKTNNRFVRGHMCPKNAADRLGEDAGYNTHTVLNAVPQLQWQNNGIWKFLEQACTTWADKYERLWVISGPAFFKQNPSMWLGQAGEVPAAVPDAIYKIVIRESQESETGIESMAFLFPNIIKSDKKTIYEFLTTIEDIEHVTGLKFLTNLNEEKKDIEKKKHEGLTTSEKHTAYEQW